MYDMHDAAHRRDHADMVISQSLALARNYDVDMNMVYAIAAYHDTGIIHGREHHHTGLFCNRTVAVRQSGLGGTGRNGHRFFLPDQQSRLEVAEI